MTDKLGMVQTTRAFSIPIYSVTFNFFDEEAFSRRHFQHIKELTNGK